MDTVFEHSAGGVVVAQDGRLVIVQTRNLKGETVYTLPKGHVEAGESTAEAAARKVTEETGLEVEHVPHDLAPSTYWFVRNGVRVKKRVDWSRFTVTGGDTADHDPIEIDEVLMLEPDDGLSLLSYASGRAVVKETLCD